MAKAVALLSGGLDSTLAVRLVMDQGIEVHALNFTSAFCTCDAGGKHSAHKGKAEGGCRSEARRVAEEFGIPIKVLAKGMDYIDVVRNPKYGYGKGMNPCVDCRIYMFSMAKRYMEEIGASFIVTGEVLGQRPMSQRLANFHAIEKDCGLEGLILRPLCAKQIEPTIPERQGLIDRERLLDMAGRGRRPQMDLAEELDVKDYPCPSGGCLLTDKIFSKKVKDLLVNKKDVTSRDLNLLKAGRHFRFDGAKIVVGRDQADNVRIRNLAGAGDALLEPVDFSGPTALVADREGGDAVEFAASLILSYAGDKADGKGLIRVTSKGRAADMRAEALPDRDFIERHMVC